MSQPSQGAPSAGEVECRAHGSFFQTWWLAVRPKTLWASIAPVVIGLAMAVEESGGGWNIVTAVVTLMAAILVQIGTNFCNDVADFQKGADTEARKGPVRVTQAGMVSVRQMWVAALVSFGLAVVACVYLSLAVGWPIAVIGVIAIVSGALYTAGPAPLGYLGLGDLLVFVFFGPVAVGGTYFIQTGEWTLGSLIAGVAPGLLAVAILVVNNLRDVDQDRAAGKRTLVVRFGRRFARVQYVGCLAISAVVPLVLIIYESWYHGTLVASLVILTLGIPVSRVVLAREDGEALNSALGATARLLLFYCVAFSFAWMFIPWT